ncbi:hypothetical protein [Streptomyces sp. NPDC005476]|uniref:hypothetical protein n=1 Tax=Streptomyces sp. NPDC005476 TaxID=3156882 RepID=UPI00345631FF
MEDLLNTLHLAVLSAAEAGHNALTSDIGDDPQRLAALLLETTSLAANLRRVSAAAIQESLAATAPAVPDEVRWLVNPLDGITELRGSDWNFAVRPHHAIGVAAELGGTIVAAHLLKLERLTLDSAIGFGPSGLVGTLPDLDHDDDVSTPLVSRHLDPAQTLAIALPVGGEDRSQALRLLADLAPAVPEFRISGSPLSDLASVAQGQHLAAYLGLGQDPDPTAPGLAVVRACGGAVSEGRTADGLRVEMGGIPELVDTVANLLITR